MSPAPSTTHQRILRELGGYFLNYLRGKECEVFYAPFDVRIPVGDEKDEDIRNVVQPDIVVICDRSCLDERGYRGAPGLVIEILSPGTSKKDLQEKYRLYERSGVKEYWVVYPREQLVDVFNLSDENRFERTGIYTHDETIKVGILEDLEIDLSRVFAE